MFVKQGQGLKVSTTLFYPSVPWGTPTHPTQSGFWPTVYISLSNTKNKKAFSWFLANNLINLKKKQLIPIVENLLHYLK